MDAPNYFMTGERAERKWEEGSEGAIDLNEQLVRNKAATFFLRVRSEAMSASGIHSGDVVIVDRSLEPLSGKIVIASVNGELLIRRLERSNGGTVRLVPDAKLAPIVLDHYSEEIIWGVVTFVIHGV